MYWNGMQRHKRYGVSIAIRLNSFINITSIHNISPRIIAADISVHGCKVRIISCYAPTLRDSIAAKQLFYRDLSKICTTENHRKIIINGDFNAEPGFCRTLSRFDGRSTVSEENCNYENENVMMFLQFCHQQKLSILNTWFDHPIHHRETWHHPNVNVSTPRKVYDYSLSESWIRQYVTDVRVRNSYFNSDHRLVVTKLRTPANKEARKYKRRLQKIGTKHNLELLQNDEIVKEVHKSIEENLKPNTLETASEMHENIITALQEGKMKIPRLRKTKNHDVSLNQDPEIEQLIKQRIELRKLTPSNLIRSSIKELGRKIKSSVKTLRNQLLKKKAKDITEAKQHRNITKMWRYAKAHDSSGLTKAPPIQCTGLVEHFQNHFNPDHSNLVIPPEMQDTPEFIRILQDSTVEMVGDPPTNAEIHLAIKQLNNGKSSLDVESEILKCSLAIPNMINTLYSYFKLIWLNKEIPEQWTMSRITPIWKGKGSANDPSKYRAISIGSVLCKVGMNIILKRMSGFYEKQLKRSQFGFRSGVGCNDGIFMIKQLQDIASSTQRKLYICFVDLTAAFDHVNRDLLFKSIKKRLHDTQNPVNIDIAQELYRKTVSFLQSQDPDEAFPTEAGVRKGGQEGPPFYNLFADYALRTYEERKKQDCKV